MDPVPTQSKRLESAVSICILLVLVSIAVAVFLKQSPKQPPTNPKEAAALELFSPAAFRTLSEARVYNAENLYEKINGKAPLYLESGFQKLSTQRFISKADDTLWAELFLYDMGNTRNAFSVLSLQRRADADTISIFHPSFGYSTTNAIFFIHGSYYIEIIGSAQSPELFEAMTELSRKIQTDLPTETTAITEINLYPTENLLPASIKLYRASAFGFADLKDTFTARYQIDNQTITTFISKRPDAQAANALADSYYKFLIDNGAEDIARLTWAAGSIVNFYGSIELIFSNGVYVAGVHEAETVEAATKAAIMLNNKLSEAGKR